MENVVILVIKNHVKLWDKNTNAGLEGRLLVFLLPRAG
jgi:hypothetical protein